MGYGKRKSYHGGGRGKRRGKGRKKGRPIRRVKISRGGRRL